MDDAWRYYSRLSAALAKDWDQAVVEAMDKIDDAPERWHPHVKGTRRHLMKRFPYSVVYRVTETHVYVVAVAHHSRRPTYWHKRQ